MIKRITAGETLNQFGLDYNETVGEMVVSAQQIGNGQIVLVKENGGQIPIAVPETPNSVLIGCSVAVAGSTVTVAPGSWLIAAVKYAKATSTMLGLDPLVDTTLKRIDLILANSLSTFEVLKGVEAASPAKPSVPVSKLEVGFILVASTGSTVEQPAGIKNLKECGDVYLPADPTSDEIHLGWNNQLKKWVGKVIQALNIDFAPADSDNTTGFFAGLLTSGKLKLHSAVDRVVSVVKGKQDKGAIFDAVADLATLKALNTTDAAVWKDRGIIVVEAMNAIFRLDRESAAAADDVLVVAPTTGVGRWHKTGGASDPALGGELSGTTSNATLSNSAVIGKLLTGLGSVASDLLATDSISLAFSKVNNFMLGIAATVRSTIATGLDVTLAGTAAATDTILQVLGKLQRQATANEVATRNVDLIAEYSSSFTLVNTIWERRITALANPVTSNISTVVYRVNSGADLTTITALNTAINALSAAQAANYTVQIVVTLSAATGVLKLNCRYQ